MHLAGMSRNIHQMAISGIYYQTGHFTNYRWMVISSNRCLTGGTIPAIYWIVFNFFVRNNTNVMVSSLDPDLEECERIYAVWPEADDFSDLDRKIFIQIGQYVILVFSAMSIFAEVSHG